MYEEALKSGVAAIKTHNNFMTAKQWRMFASALSIETRYPGINGIGVIFRIKPTELSQFIAEQKENWAKVRVFDSILN